VQSEIALVERNNQAFVSSHQIAEKFSKRHGDVLRIIHSYLDLENLNDFNKRNFELAADDRAGRAKRGRPRLAEVLMTRDGFVLVALSLTGKRALEWKVKFIEAFNSMEKSLSAEIPQLRARIAELEQSQAQPPKQLAGPRKGMIPVPVIEPNLWNEQEIVAWEMQPMDQVDELLITMAKLRHCNHVAQGLEQKKKVLTDKLVQEELNRRIEVKDLTTKRFALPKQQKKRRSKTTH